MTFLNTPTTSPGIDRPRMRVMYSGNPLPNCKSASITSSNNYTGDTFEAVFTVNLLSSGVGSMSWWSSQSSVIRVEVQIGLVPDGAPETAAVWKSLLTGVVDNIKLDPLQATVSIDGRDLTALLRDSGPGGYAVNQTSSELVTKLATMNGLTPVVTPTTNLVGRIFSIDHAQTGLNGHHHITSQWDAVVELAKYEGFDAFVSGTSLYFQPPVAVTSPQWVVNMSQDQESGIVHGNVYALCLQRTQHIAKGIKVTVSSWHPLQAKAVKATAGSTSNAAQQYNVVKPGLTQDQAQKYANTILTELLKHERTISGSAPGDMLLTPRVMMAVQGTNTAFDQAYFPLTVTRHIDVDHGFTMDFTAKNQSPLVQNLQPTTGQ